MRSEGAPASGCEAAAVGNLGRQGWHRTGAMAGWAGIGLGFVCLGLAPSLPWALAASALAGCAGSITHVSRAVYFRQTVPGADLGKIYGILSASTTLTWGIGMLLCGLLLERLPAGRVVALAGALMGLSAALILARRPARQELVA